MVKFGEKYYQSIKIQSAYGTRQKERGSEATCPIWCAVLKHKITNQHFISLSHTHTHTHTMSQSSFGPSAGSSVRVTVIYLVPSISTDYTWSFRTHPPSQTHTALCFSYVLTNTTEHIHS